MPRTARAIPEQPFLQECFSYAPDSGVLTWRRRPRRHFVDDRIWRVWNTRFAERMTGCPRGDGYLLVRIDGANYRAHRLIWKLVTGKEPAGEIDHKDNNPANNRWDNLREATHRQNSFNMKAKRATGHAKGVYYMVAGKWARWIANINVDGRTIYLGCFETEQRANTAYYEAAKRHFGAFANRGQ